ncbi:MAG: ATP-dependent Clp protease proteolytic subunit [Nitrospira sp.]|nr:ATP-dependent Clp protease proteolytic subunit [Nitrospira sp.]
MGPLDEYIKGQLNTRMALLREHLDGADTISVVSPIMPGIDTEVRDAIEMNRNKKRKLAIILQTPGGVVEVVERMVDVIRNSYEEVIAIVPDQAMSAGTVLALSADRIMMDYFSRLGPIDPQIAKDEKLVPALAYLKQYEKLNQKAAEGSLTTAEYAMLRQLDVGELYQFEQARELSVELLIKWLSQYKFKNWKKMETSRKRVTESIKQTRAKAIAHILNDPERWHSHGRGIGIETLRKELKLQIEDYSENQPLAKAIRDYFSLLMDYLHRQNRVYFIHTERYFS